MRIILSLELIDQVVECLEELLDELSRTVNIDVTAREILTKVGNSQDFFNFVERNLFAKLTDEELPSSFLADSSVHLDEILRDSLGITSEVEEVEPPADDEEREPLEDDTIEEAITEIVGLFESLIGEITVRMLKAVETETSFEVKELSKKDLDDVEVTGIDNIVLITMSED